MKTEPRDPMPVIIARIEDKYKECTACGRRGVRKGSGKIRCVYCGELAK